MWPFKKKLEIPFKVSDLSIPNCPKCNGPPSVVCEGEPNIMADWAYYISCCDIHHASLSNFDECAEGWIKKVMEYKKEHSK